MTASSYHARALASTEFSFEFGETGLFPACLEAVSISGSALQYSPYSDSPYVRCCRALATFAGPGGESPFGHLVRALTCEHFRKSCSVRLLERMTRFRSAILRSVIRACFFQDCWRFATWPEAGCLVGSRVSPKGDTTGWRRGYEEG